MTRLTGDRGDAVRSSRRTRDLALSVMDTSEAQEFLARCGRNAAKMEAQRLGDEIRIWLKCGYELDELRLLHFQNPREPSEIVPASFYEDS